MSLVGFDQEEHFLIMENEAVIVKSDIEIELLEKIVQQYREGTAFFEVDGYFVRVVKTSQGYLFNVRPLKQFSDSDFMNPLANKVLNSISDGITICDRHGKIVFQNDIDIEIVGLDLTGRYAKMSLQKD